MNPSIASLQRMAGYGPAGAPILHRMLGGAAPAGDATSLTTGVPAQSYGPGTYQFRTQILARRLPPAVSLVNVTAPMAAFLRFTTGGRVTITQAVLSVGAEERVTTAQLQSEGSTFDANPGGGEARWWLNLAGTLTATSAFTLAEMNTAVAEAVTAGMRWGAAPGMVAPTDPADLRAVLVSPSACSGGQVRRQGVPWLRACTRLTPVAAPAPTAGPCTLGLGAAAPLRTRPDPAATGPTMPQGATVTFLARTGARFGAAVFYRVSWQGQTGYLALDPAAFPATHCVSRLPMEPLAAPESWNALDRPQSTPAPPNPTQTAPTVRECTVTIRDVAYLRGTATFDRTGAPTVPAGSRVTLLANTGLTDGPWTLYQVRVASGTLTGRLGYVGLASSDFGSPSAPGCVAQVPRVMAPIPAPTPPRPTVPSPQQPPVVVPAPAPPPVNPPRPLPPLLPPPPAITPAPPVVQTAEGTPTWLWILLGLGVAGGTFAVVRSV